MTDPALRKWQSAIEEKKSLLGADTVTRMAEIFLDELQHQLNAAGTALNAGDLPTARKALHHLSGSSGALDFEALTEAILATERACLAGNQKIASEYFSTLQPLALDSTSKLMGHFQFK